MRSLLPVLLVSVACASSAFAQNPLYPDPVRYDPSVPTMEQVLGYGPGERISSHGEVSAYLAALAAASDRVALVPYGESWEGRRLQYLVVGTPERLADLDTLRAGFQQLADPRGLGEADQQRLLQEMPVLTWLSYTVHGDEISGSDAALLTAYHLAAAEDDPLAETVRRDSLVVIDPLQNPDGRDRFVHHFRSTRGRWPDPDQQSAEHNQPWPGGRTNHYHFDMNRDWFAMSQPETRARVREFLRWYPQVYVDLHEMGSDSTYYFAPPARPYNPELQASQLGWLENFGRANGKWFDRMGFAYFTREVFDAFYPGYGDGWPGMHGAIGMTYEQASARGLVVERRDETTMTYADTVQRHFIASLSTAQCAAENREQMLTDFVTYRREAVRQGSEGPIREFLFPPGRDPGRTDRLMGLLVDQGVEVQRAQAPFQARSLTQIGGASAEQADLPAGTYIVSTAQPAKHLLQTLLAQRQDMTEEFLAEQKRRQAKRLSPEMYDITAWSLPLLFDVECWSVGEASDVATETLTAAPQRSGAVEGFNASVAYLLPWGTQASVRALAALLRAEVRCQVAGKSFTQGGQRYPRGTIIVRTTGSGSGLEETVRRVAAETGARFVATGTSWVEDGINFGSNSVKYVKPPRVAVLYDRPTSSNSVGFVRCLLEQVYGYPVTLLRGRQLAGADLQDYDVLVFPELGGGSGRLLDPAAGRIKDWVRAGGTLITLGSASRWLTGDKVGLLATEREKRKEGKKGEGDEGGKPKGEKAADEEATDPGDDEKAAAGDSFDYEKAIQPEDEYPAGTPGAIFRVELDPDHWLSSGYGASAHVMVTGNTIFTPVKLDRGTNVAVYGEGEQLIPSGFVWPDSVSQYARKSYLVHQPSGRGHVVAFAEDPNFRLFCDGTNLLFLNAVFFGAAW